LNVDRPFKTGDVGKVFYYGGKIEKKKKRKKKKINRSIN